MNYNEQMRKKLLSNIKVVSLFILISFIFTGIKLYQILGTDILDIQGEMLFKDFFPLFVSGFGIVALLVSVLTYYIFDNLYPKHQVLLFTLVGMMFMPFTIILFVIGIMKYMEKSKFKVHFFGGSLLGMILFGVIIVYVLLPYSNNEVNYLNEHVISGEYVMNENNYIEVTTTGVYRGDSLQSVNFHLFMELDAPDLSRVGGEFVQVLLNDTQSCIVHSFMEAQEAVEVECTFRNQDTIANPAFTINDFTNFENISIRYGSIGLDTSLTIEHGSAIIITENVINENVYEKYNSEEE